MRPLGGRAGYSLLRFWKSQGKWRRGPAWGTQPLQDGEGHWPRQGWKRHDWPVLQEPSAHESGKSGRSPCGPQPGVGAVWAASRSVRGSGSEERGERTGGGPGGASGQQFPSGPQQADPHGGQTMGGRAGRGCRAGEFPETDQEMKSRQSTRARHARLPRRRHRAAWPWPVLPVPPAGRGDFLGTRTG